MQNSTQRFQNQILVTKQRIRCRKRNKTERQSYRNKRHRWIKKKGKERKHHLDVGHMSAIFSAGKIITH